MSTNPANTQVLPTYNLPTPGSYVTFDAVSMQQLMINRLNQGDSGFTDQIYQGSNMRTIIDLLSYNFSLILFYASRMANEGMFSQAQLYENINRVVKILSYKPTGYTTCIVPIQVSVNQTLLPGTYTIPKFSYIPCNGTFYSTNQDITFTKSLSGFQNLTQISDNYQLYNGVFTEYPLYQAQGIDYETVTLTLLDSNNNNLLIDSTNIFVYIYDTSTQTWQQWNQTASLYLENGNSQVFEIRFNENGRITIKFGNNINGQALKSTNQVAIYYLKTDGTSGYISNGILDGNSLFYFSSPQWTSILQDCTPPNITYMGFVDAAKLDFTNPTPSTQFGYPENVESIRNNAPNTFNSQYRLVNTNDFQNYIVKNFGNFVQSVAVCNNNDYLNVIIQYYYNLGLTNPNLTSRILSNQVQFPTSSDQNNIYIFCVPIVQNQSSTLLNNNYLTSSQKQLIADSINPYKITTSEIIISDPVYMGINFGMVLESDTYLDYQTISSQTNIIITRNSNSRVNVQQIQQQITNIILNYFSGLQLGSLIDLNYLNNQILNMGGIQSFVTQRTDSAGNTTSINGLSLLLFNMVYYAEDISVSSQNIQLDFFKFPFWFNPQNLINQIQVVNNNVNS